MWLHKYNVIFFVKILWRHNYNVIKYWKYFMTSYIWHYKILKIYDVISYIFIYTPTLTYNIPFGHKMDKLANVFYCKAFQNLPKLGFWIWKCTIWQHCLPAQKFNTLSHLSSPQSLCMCGGTPSDFVKIFTKRKWRLIKSLICIQIE
jgi:hypothetical protein